MCTEKDVCISETGECEKRGIYIWIYVWHWSERYVWSYIFVGRICNVKENRKQKISVIALYVLKELVVQPACSVVMVIFCCKYLLLTAIKYLKRKKIIFYISGKIYIIDLIIVIQRIGFDW